MNAPAMRWLMWPVFAGWAAVGLALALWVSPVSGERPPRASADAAIVAVGAIGITVADLDRSVAFYTDVLGFRKLSETEVAGDAFEHLQGVFAARARIARLRLGEEELELTEYLAPRGRPFPQDSRGHDRWFQHVAIIVSDMDRAYARLREHRVTHASSGPQRIPDSNVAAAGIRAFYFRDPDGHYLELLSFPSGKGDAKWHARDGRLFLGIDHTAIVVSDTEASLAFYRDRLGLSVAGTSENHGTEQEHLNSVFGARLRITGLRAASGPAIELLEYITPRDGRPYPSDARANDLLHWQTRLVARSLSSTERMLRAARAPLVSSGITSAPDRASGFTQAIIVRDPDGHAMEVVQ